MTTETVSCDSTSEEYRSRLISHLIESGTAYDERDYINNHENWPVHSHLSANGGCRIDITNTENIVLSQEFTQTWPDNIYHQTIHGAGFSCVCGKFGEITLFSWGTFAEVMHSALSIDSSQVLDQIND